MKFITEWQANPTLDFAAEEEVDLRNWVADGVLNFSSKWNEAPDLDFVVNEVVEPKVWSQNASLDFSTEWESSGQLEFVVGGTEPVITPVTDVAANSYVFTPLSFGAFDYIINIDCSSTIQQPTSSGKSDLIFDIQADCQVVAPTTNGTCIYDINVERGIRNITKAVSQVSNKIHTGFTSLFNDSPQLDVGNKVTILDAAGLQKKIVAMSKPFGSIDNVVEFRLLNGDYITQDVSTVNHAMGNITNDCQFNIEQGKYITNHIVSDYYHPPRADCEIAFKWMGADKLSKEWDDAFESGIPSRYNIKSKFENGVQPVGYRPEIIVPVEPVEPEIPPELKFLTLWDESGELDFLRIEVEALIIMNSITMYHTSKLGVKTYINPTTWSIANDLDSYAWTLSCSLYDEGVLDLITTDDLFTLEVNDIAWSFHAFKYKRVQQQQYTGYSVTFVSATQKLGSPYCDLKNISLDNPIGAVQLAESVLGDFPLINNGVTEWTLYADTVEYMDAEPKAIVSAIMAAAGAVMLPSIDGNSIKIQPRYKVPAWELAGLADEECDVLVDGNYMISDSGEITNATQYNAVTVSGESGVMTKVIRSGTDGATEATEFTTQLHQDHSTALDYAAKVFSESGTLELATISLGLDNNLLESGAIVRIKNDSGDRTGISLGVTVSGDSIDHVYQTATIEFKL